MRAIDIPPAYWTIRPRPFSALIGTFNPALQDIAAAVAAGAAPVVNGHDLALRQELAALDGDRDTIRADAAGEVTALATTPTGDAVRATGAADSKVLATDSSVASVQAYDVPGFQIEKPPYPPPEGGAPPAPPKGPGETPGQPEPPPPDPNAPPPPLVAQLDALYRELLDRPIDAGGLATWMAAITLQGHTLAWVREQILASPEYQQRQAPPPPPAPPPPIDTSGFVTHEQLAAVVNGLDLTINLLV